MNWRFIDWIWRVRGTVALNPGLSDAEAFARLDPLFRERGTTAERQGSTLTFRKKDQPAQDKMSVFDHGVLSIEQDVTGPVLRFDLFSKALLACFLAPFLFLAIGQLTPILSKSEKPETEQAAPKKKVAEVPMNPIDKALGAPAPDKPGKDAEKPRGRKPSSTTAYVFAGIFVALYIGGRVLEDWLVRRLFRRRLAGS